MRKGPLCRPESHLCNCEGLPWDSAQPGPSLDSVGIGRSFSETGTPLPACRHHHAELGGDHQPEPH